MIIYLYGPDAYRRQQKTKQIIDQYIKKYSKTTVERIYIDENLKDINEVCSRIDRQSLFDGKRMIVISGIIDLTVQEIKKVITFLKKKVTDENSVILITEEKKLGKEFDEIKKISSETQVKEQSFEYMNPQQLTQFISFEMQERGITLTPNVIKNLVNIYAKDTWGLVTELEKIALSTTPYSEDEEQATLVGGLFNQLYRLKSSSFSIKIPILEKILHFEDAGKIFNMLAYQHILTNPQTFADYDELIKNGKIDYDQALIDIALSEK